ncbi:hypothetical protein [Marinimicrococcus flavescens]
MSSDVSCRGQQRMSVEIFQFRGPENCEWVTTENTLNFQMLPGIDVSQWRPFHVQIVDRNDNGVRLVKSDVFSVGLNSVFIMNARARHALESALSPFGSILKVECNDTSLWMYYVKNYVNALDLKKSDIFWSDEEILFLYASMFS